MSENQPQAEDNKPTDVVGEWKGGAIPEKQDQPASGAPASEQSLFREPAWRPSDQIEKDKIDESAHPEAEANAD